MADSKNSILFAALRKPPSPPMKERKVIFLDEGSLEFRTIRWDGKIEGLGGTGIGPRGPKGDTGKTGAQGPKGDPGAKGDAGTPGTDGEDGTDGINGSNGADGADGSDGVDGSVWFGGAGSPNVIAPVGAVPGDWYLDVINGDVWHMYPPGPTWTWDFNIMGPQGEQGEQGIQGEQGDASTVAGPAGAAGEKWFLGDWPPSVVSGAVAGDLFLAGIDGTYYEYDGASWNLIGSLMGPSGGDGSNGLDGEPGTPATVSVGSTTTLADGLSATVTDSDPSASNTVLHFGIPRGVKGDPGTNGTNGTNGEKWFTGAGNPSTGIGAVGDWYLDSTTGNYLEKTDVLIWTLRGNLKGPAGTNGTDGAPGGMVMLQEFISAGSTTAFIFTAPTVGLYRHLKFFFKCGNTSGDNTALLISFNADVTGSNYDCVISQCNSAGAASGVNGDRQAAYSTAAAAVSYMSAGEITIPWWSDGSNYKSWQMSPTFGRNTAGTSFVRSAAGHWRPAVVVPITSITFTNAVALVAGSRFAMYGVI